MNIEQKLAFIDRVEAHLVKQGKRSMRKHFGRDVCAYRGENGCQCAIGPYIADDHYHPQLEGNGSDTDAVQQALMRSKLIEGLEPRDEYFLIGIQDVHDNAGPHGDRDAEWPEEQFCDYVRQRLKTQREEVKAGDFELDANDDAEVTA